MKVFVWAGYGNADVYRAETAENLKVIANDMKEVFQVWGVESAVVDVLKTENPSYKDLMMAILEDIDVHRGSDSFELCEFVITK